MNVYQTRHSKNRGELSCDRTPAKLDEPSQVDAIPLGNCCGGCASAIRRFHGSEFFGKLVEYRRRFGWSEMRIHQEVLEDQLGIAFVGCL